MSTSSLLEELKKLKPKSDNEAILLRAAIFLVDRVVKQEDQRKRTKPVHRDALEDMD